jgi:D-glycero-D-manno-heptose 1,7-bisphosphate phosphatase
VFCEGIFELVKEAIALDMLVIVVTNQSGIARGYYSEEQFLALSEWMKTQFTDQNAPIDDVFYCPHHPLQGSTGYTIDCDCRKPKVGMFEQAASEYNIDMSASIMIGDKDTDMKAGLNAGIKKNYWLDHSASTRNIDIVNAKNATIKIIHSLAEVDLTQHV